MVKLLLLKKTNLHFYNRTVTFARSMKKDRHLCQLKHITSSILMLFLLAWLTVCLPYVSKSQQAVNHQLENTTEDIPESDNSNSPLTDTNEEKTESTSLLSEYLHHLVVIEHTFEAIASFRKCRPSALYLAYHPEMVIPPPEA